VFDSESNCKKSPRKFLKKVLTAFFQKESVSSSTMRLGPQDNRVGGAAAVKEGGRAPVTPTQQGTVFSAKDVAAEFRTKVSSQMSLEYVNAQEGAKISTMISTRVSQRGEGG